MFCNNYLIYLSGGKLDSAFNNKLARDFLMSETEKTLLADSRVRDLI